MHILFIERKSSRSACSARGGFASSTAFDRAVIGWSRVGVTTRGPGGPRRPQDRNSVPASAVLEMGGGWEMAVNVQLKPGQKHNRYELLAWLNMSLHTRFTKVEQICSGAAFCQLMDWLFPGSVDLRQVRFQPIDEADSLQNYSVLQAGFKKAGVVQSIPVEELIRGSPEAGQDFLSWFKVFFDANHSGREYKALEARGGQNLIPITPANNPTTISGANNPTTISGANKPTTISGANNPTTISGANKPTTISGANKPTTISGANNPTTISGANKPTTISGANKPTTISGANKPTTISGANKPTTISGANNPTTISGANNGTTISGANNPTTISGANNGTTSNPTTSMTPRSRALAQINPTEEGTSEKPWRRLEAVQRLCRSPIKMEARVKQEEEVKEVKTEKEVKVETEERTETGLEMEVERTEKEGKTEEDMAKEITEKEEKLKKEEHTKKDKETEKRTQREEETRTKREEEESTEREEETKTERVLGSGRGMGPGQDQDQGLGGVQNKDQDQGLGGVQNKDQDQGLGGVQNKDQDQGLGGVQNKDQGLGLGGVQNKDQDQGLDGVQNKDQGLGLGGVQNKDQGLGLGGVQNKDQGLGLGGVQNKDQGLGLGGVQNKDQGLGLAQVSRPTARQILGMPFPRDILSTCQHTPYTLYLHRHVDLGAGETAFVLLIGYFHQKSGVRQVRLLEVLQPGADTAAALLDCLRGALSRLGLPPANLAWFYCDRQDPEEKQAALEAGVRDMTRPGMVSLCGLPGLAGRACQAAMAAVSEPVLALVGDLRHHFSGTADERVKQLFADIPEFDVLLPVSSQCVFLTRTLQAIGCNWVELTSYFNGLSGAGNGKQIHGRLRDLRLRATVLFLAQALEPLAAFQEALQGGSMDLAVVLQVLSQLLRSYSAWFLRPSAVERFLRRRDLAILDDPASQVQVSEVFVDGIRNILSKNTSEPGGVEGIRGELSQSAAVFYRELTRSMSGSLVLGNAALMHIGVLLQPCGKMAVSGRVVAELANQMGVCGCLNGEEGGDKVRLSEEYLDYTLGEEEGDLEGGLTAEQHWGQVLKGLGQTSVLRRLILTLLALPETLHRDTLFTKAFEKSSEVPPEPDAPEKDSTKEPTSHDPPDCEDDWLTENSEDYHTPLPGPRTIRRDPDSDTDHSSDVIMITEMNTANSPPVKVNRSNGLLPKRSEYMMIEDDDDDEDDDIIWTDTVQIKSPLPQPNEQNSAPPGLTSTPKQTDRKSFYQDGRDYDVGELVWGHVEGYSLWPGVVRVWKSRPAPDGMRRVEWYGDNMFSEINTQGLLPFAAFAQAFCANSFATLVTYREAVFQSLQVARERSSKVFEEEDLLKALLDWAFGGFKPSGPDGLAPPPYVDDQSMSSVNGKRPKINMGQKLSQFNVMKVASSTPNKDNDARSLSLPSKLKQVSVRLHKLSLSLSEGGSVRLDKHRRSKVGQRKRAKPRKSVRPSDECPSSEEQPCHIAARSKKNVTPPDECNSPDWQPPHKRTKSYYKPKESSFVYVQPDQKHREAMVQKVLDKGKNIERFCLCCGTDDVQIQHPLFEGGLCARCQDNFTETLYRYDEDGYQSYCTVCCAGLEVILCGNDSCCRSYCVDCLDILVGVGTFDCLKEVDPWICYLCQPNRLHGALKPRCDWSIRVQHLFVNNSGMEFEPHRVYPSISASLRRPIRVLSLFDGIATGYLVLKELGFKVEKYVASEVCEESITVSKINHEGKITYVNDVRFITTEHIEEWGPFDLLIGGSPCNDLSIVNPARKGLFEGTGRLFFEYYRILHILKPKEEDPRPFFWMFENVVFMNNHDRINICRFLECDPVVVDAVKVSPAHRSRYFWGNIPGMNRPITASKNDKINLQDCLEIGRTAKYTKVRTITTNPASLKQGKDVSKLPVLDDQGQEDNLWITELERIFGFPKHYTDVKNMNRQQRQKVLGKSWSVPVIRHLFAPLKDYYACEQPTQGCLATAAETGEGKIGSSPQNSSPYHTSPIRL